MPATPSLNDDAGNALDHRHKSTSVNHKPLSESTHEQARQQQAPTVRRTPRPRRRNTGPAFACSLPFHATFRPANHFHSCARSFRFTHARRFAAARWRCCSLRFTTVAWPVLWDVLRAASRPIRPTPRRPVMPPWRQASNVTYSGRPASLRALCTHAAQRPLNSAAPVRDGLSPVQLAFQDAAESPDTPLAPGQRSRSSCSSGCITTSPVL